MLLEPESMLGVIGGSQSLCCRSQSLCQELWVEPRVYAAGARVYASLVIIVSAPVQRIGFQGFSVQVRTFRSELGDCWDGGLGLGLGLDNKPKKIQNMLKAFYLNSNFFVRWCQDLICMCDFLLMMALNNSFTFHIVIAWQGRLEITLTD